MSPPAFTCRAVLFDLDGVLVNSEAVVVRTWHRWAARHRLSIPDLVRRAHGRRSVETVREVAPFLDADVEVEWLSAAELSDSDGLTAIPGAMALFKAIPSNKRAVVTSGGRALATFRLETAGFRVPQVLVSADDVERGKPAPDGYISAARQLVVNPHECVVVEDTPAGIAAARAAGTVVVGLSSTFPAQELTGANIVVASLTHVTASSREGYIQLVINPAV